MTVLKSLFAYAGKYKYLTILSLVFSMISAILLLMPFIMIWKVIEVILAEYPNFAQGSIAIQYGWYALIFAAVGILLYVSGLLCSHLAAFRIASNMRKKALHHAVQLPLGYFAKEGSGKLRKIIDKVKEMDNVIIFIDEIQAYPHFLTLLQEPSVLMKEKLNGQKI